MKTNLVRALEAAASTTPDPHRGALADDPTGRFSAALHAAIARVMGPCDDERQSRWNDGAPDVGSDDGDPARDDQPTHCENELSAHLRHMRETLREELLRRSQQGTCPPVQQRRIATGVAIVSELLASVTRALDEGASIDDAAVSGAAVDALRDALEMGPETPRERAGRSARIDDAGPLHGEVIDLVPAASSVVVFGFVAFIDGRVAHLDAGDVAHVAAALQPQLQALAAGQDASRPAATPASARAHTA